MAFKLERFDIIKQNYDNTGVYFYHDTVGPGTIAAPKDGDALATIVATDFFNSVVEELQGVGALMFISATDGAGVYRVTQLYDSTGDVEVKIATTDSTTDTRVGDLTTLTTTAKTTAVAAINEVNAKVAANQADSTAADVAGVVTDLNALLAKLKTAKLMAADA